MTAPPSPQSDNPARPSTPGWYADPAHQGHSRFFDGERWQPGWKPTPSENPPASPPVSRRERVLCAACAVLMSLPLAVSPFLPLVGPFLLPLGTVALAAALSRRTFGVGPAGGAGLGAASATIAWVPISGMAIWMIMPLCAPAEMSVLYVPALVAAAGYLVLSALAGYLRNGYAWIAASLWIPVAFGVMYEVMDVAGTHFNC